MEFSSTCVRTTVLIILSLHSVHSAIPDGSNDAVICERVCQCDDKISYADCRKLNLERIPKATGKCEEAWHVDFNYNMIEYMQPGDFEGYTSVEILLLGNNQIDMLQPNMWSKSPLMTQLHINNNHLTNITQRAFAKVTSLTHLYLDYNQIDNLHPDAFYGLTRLGKLFLLNNLIVTLPDEAFKYLRSLSTLDLSKNKLSEIKTNVFNGLTRLKRLDLSTNEISNVEAGSFRDLNKLNWISFSGNNLLHISVSVLIGVPRLETVKLSQNNISSIDNLGTFLYQANNLVEFAVNGNPLMCDCAMEPLARWYRRHDPRQSAICESPGELQGVYLTKYNESCATTPAPQKGFTLMARNSTINGIGTWIALSIVLFFIILVIGIFVLFWAYKQRSTISKNRYSVVHERSSNRSESIHMNDKHQYDEPIQPNVRPKPPTRSTSYPKGSRQCTVSNPTAQSDISTSGTPKPTRAELEPLNSDQSYIRSSSITSSPTRAELEPLSSDIPEPEFDENYNCINLSPTNKERSTNGQLRKFPQKTYVISDLSTNFV